MSKGKQKVDYSMEDWNIELEKFDNPDFSIVIQHMRSHGFEEQADAAEKSMELQSNILFAIRRAERFHMLGLDKDARKIIHDLSESTGVRICNLSSRNGIPDYVWIASALPSQRVVTPDGSIVEIPQRTDEELMEDTIIRGTPYLVSDTSASPPQLKERQAFLGRCNAREETMAKLAARRFHLNLSAFVTKSVLLMARFINRHRRNEQGHPYHPGEAYLFMEHGVQMQDAFTPEEVQQAMEKVGISGCKVADDFMAELKRLRDARKNPEA